MINQNFPDLYNFLKICVIQQLGTHSLCDIDNNVREGCDQDLELIHKLISLSDKSKFEDKNFLNELGKVSKKNLMVHIVRDCQVIETGSHYSNLIFKVDRGEKIYILKFRTKFKQDFGKLPTGVNKIEIIYAIDNFEKNDKCYRTIGMGGNINFYQERISNKSFDITDDIISKLPCKYLLPKNKIEPKLKPDSCSIS